MSTFIKTPDQQRALTLLSGPARNTLLFGGSRSGKSFILIYAILVRALRAPGSRHAILRRHANAVKSSIWLDTLPKVLEVAYPKLRARRHQADCTLTLPNHSEIWCGGLEDDRRADKILGREFATMYFNECSELAYSGVATALTRLAQKCALRNRAYFDCNPTGKSHWCHTLFVERRDPESGAPLRFPGHYASMVMNPSGNRGNLPDGYLEETLAGLSEMKRRRFLDGAWSDDREGALWTPDMIAATRVAAPPAGLARIVVGVDPAVTGSGDATGIVTAGRDDAGRYYVLSDASIQASPRQWVDRVIAEYNRFRADRVVGEVNQGGELIEFALRSANANVSYRAVRASRGKVARAEPIAALYERRLVHHAGEFPELEEELYSYGSAACNHSPDRLDALVWALSDLAEHPGGRRFVTA